MRIKATFRAIVVTTILSSFAIPVLAANSTRPGPLDNRVRTVVYHARDVTQIYGHYGFTTSIEFASGEKIETISVGDSEAWQIVKPSQDNLIFVKPLEQQGDTNMIVVTNKRIYNFMMFARQASSHNASNLSFAVKFQYPNEQRQIIMYNDAKQERVNAHKAEQNISLNAVSPENWNFSYNYAGTESLRPNRVFDDGTFTYFKFNRVTNVPAIFAVDESGNESLINFTVKGQYIVVERTAHQFTLRDGDLATCIFNLALGVGQYDAMSPQRQKSAGLFGGLFSNNKG